MRSDPSFFHQGCTTTPTKPDKPFSRNFNTNKPISVHKTDLSTTNDPYKNCPLHNKPHPLKRCRTFRNKLLEDRKAFLREKGICFKCCASISHLAKDCRFPVKCFECDSTSHDTAMHLAHLLKPSRLLHRHESTAGREKMIPTWLSLEQAAQKFAVQASGAAHAQRCVS